MEKEFVPYELALRLKKLGFDEHCFGIYDMDTRQFIQNILCTISDTCTNEAMGCISDVNWITAPTFSAAFRWFREKHSLYSAVIPYNPKKDYYECVVRGIEEEDEDDDWEVNDTYGYSEAELACLNKLIEILENNID